MNLFPSSLPLPFVFGALFLSGITTLPGEGIEPPTPPPPPGTAANPELESIPKRPPPTAVSKPLENYQQILGVLPASPPAKDARDWSQDEKGAANSVFREILVQPKARAKFKVRVGEIANWPGPTLFVEVPNREGYHIRIFGGFQEETAGKLRQLNKGDEVILEGNFHHVAFEDVWNSPTLSICLSESSFTLTPATKSRHGDILVISAVYGSGANFADVTARVNGLVHQPDIDFAAKPEWLKADPTPGWNKALVIVYDFAGKRQIYTTGEGGRVNADILASHATAAPPLKEAAAETAANP
ncbi:MAG: hypothetical protein ACAI34_16265 [Verrucomicrobium sp.]|nr:hypothetical protein [Verrucomicrobium sp.]